MMGMVGSIWCVKTLKHANLGERGSALIEAALGLPVLLSALIGVFEIANFYFISAAVENAVLHASRFGVTGGSEEGQTREEQVRATIAEQTFGQVDMSTVQIETLVYQQFGDIGEPEPFTDENNDGQYNDGEPFSDVNGNGTWDDDMAIAGLGGAGDIVLYRVRYEAKSLTGFADWAHRALNIQSTVAVRNEPF